MMQNVESFGKAVIRRHRIEELRNQYQPETQVVLDFSETEFISRAAAHEAYNSGFAMKLSEPVRRMMQVVAGDSS